MKQEKGPIQKLHAAADRRTSKITCGTLSYLAECRGASQKSDAQERKRPAVMQNRFERYYPVDR
jgi:hypothetical protein